MSRIASACVQRHVVSAEQQFRVLIEQVHFRALVEHSSDSIQLTDSAGKILYCNQSTGRVLGYQFLEVVGRDVVSWIHPDDLSEAEAVFGDCVKHPLVPLTREFRLRRKDGNWIDVEGIFTNRVCDPAIGSIVVNYRDVTERKRADEARFRLASIVEASDDAIIGKNLDGVITSWNRGAARMYGYSAEEIIGQPVTILMPPEHTGEMQEILDKLKRGERIDHFETIRVGKNGCPIHISLTISPIQGAKGRIIGAAAIERDVTEYKKALEALRRTQEKLKIALESEKEVARSDFLTGLANRRAFYETAEFETRRMRRYQRPLSLAFIDIDDFKPVNDRLGHDAGDELLRCVAATMKSTLRESDVVARIGGDEFAILLPETDYEATKNVLSKLQSALNAVMAKNGWTVTFSIGATTSPTAPSLFEDIMRQVDDLMYSAKKAGKNQMIHVPVCGSTEYQE